MTPLGGPVEPLVYMMQAIVSALGSLLWSESSGSFFPISRTSSIEMRRTPSRADLILSRMACLGVPSYTTSRNDGTLAITLATTGSRSAFVKIATQPGSFNECSRPLSPRVSYAVAMVVLIVEHPWAKSCQFTLKRNVSALYARGASKEQEKMFGLGNYLISGGQTRHTSAGKPNSQDIGRKLVDFDHEPRSRYDKARGEDNARSDNRSKGGTRENVATNA